MSLTRNYANPQVFVINPALTPVNVAATSNQTGTYWNGPTSSGKLASFTYAAGTLTIDSQSVSVGDRILFAAQTSAYQNGIYVCVTAGASGTPAVLVRAPDFNNIEQMQLGMYVPIFNGTTKAGSFYMLVGPKPGTVGVDAITFVSKA